MKKLNKQPDFTDVKFLRKLSKGMGYSSFGEPAWPNDLLYMFPVVILGTLGVCVCLAVLEPSEIGERADPFATPLEILPEWYFFPTFNLLRVLPDKLLGVLAMASVPAGLILVPFLEANSRQNPWRRPVGLLAFMLGFWLSLLLAIGAVMPIDKALNLGIL